MTIEEQEQPYEVIRPPSQEKTLEWITALSAAGLRYRLTRKDGKWVLYLPPTEADRALREIAAYEEDNRNWPPDFDEIEPVAGADQPGKVRANEWAIAFLVFLFVWLGPYDQPGPLLRAGASDAGRIVAGEWWRVITALTLHAGVVHLAGNCIFLFIFGCGVGGWTGNGVALLLLFLSGVLGNLANALLAHPSHLSVGASTAVFGALGILAVCSFLSKGKSSGPLRNIWNRAWIPVFAALALLGFLGSNPGSDLGAHALGFGAGLVLGFPAFRLSRRSIPEWVQRTALVATGLIVLAAWKAAVNSV